MRPSDARREEGMISWHSVCFDSNSTPDRLESSFRLLFHFYPPSTTTDSTPRPNITTIVTLIRPLTISVHTYSLEFCSLVYYFLAMCPFTLPSVAPHPASHELPFALVIFGANSDRVARRPNRDNSHHLVCLHHSCIMLTGLADRQTGDTTDTQLRGSRI